MIPVEKALMSLMGIHIPKEEMAKRIPFLSFVVKRDVGAVFISPSPLPAADKALKAQIVADGEILYRADCIKGGKRELAMGILRAGKKPEGFLKLLAEGVRSGSMEADCMGIYDYLAAHFILCRLESFAKREVSFWGKGQEGAKACQEADRFYYQEVLSYVEAGRKCLNVGIPLPPFPKRDVFMAKWYQEHRSSIKGKERGTPWEK